MKQASQNFIDQTKIPEYVTRVTSTLQKEGFGAYLVGGCVRDLILKREPKDWDVTTNATPEQIQALFEKTVYENNFGTVMVCIPTKTKEVSRENHTSPQPSPTSGGGEIKYDIVEVTPYRLEATYSDFRHPDEVHFSDKLEDDLKRRDFTVNSIAYDVLKDIIVDPYNGQQDIKDKSLRAVGEATERFQEDALRMLRAVRFSCQLNFAISHETLIAISENAHLIKNISFERIRDEFEKIILSPEPMIGIGMLSRLGLLKHFIPELEEGIGCEQKGEHIYEVFEHMLHALGHACEKKWPLHIRLAALFHDIGKPRTRRWDETKAGGKGKYTFYGHEVIGARMVAKIMERMRFSKELSEKVVKLVRYHMFFSDTEQITLSAVRRTIVNVGRENIWDLMEVRECDRVGMKKKEAPYRLRKYHAMIEEALRAPTTVGMLKINGEVLIKELNIKAGPRMGWILHALLEECLENDSKNHPEELRGRALELDKLSDGELKALGEKGKERKEEKEEQEIEELRKKHGVK
jgi:putative nucleotidyltransferase with HDIG domain